VTGVEAWRHLDSVLCLLSDHPVHPLDGYQESSYCEWTCVSVVAQYFDMRDEWCDSGCSVSELDRAMG